MKDLLDFLEWLVTFCLVYGSLITLVVVVIIPPWKYKNYKEWLKAIFSEEDD